MVVKNMLEPLKLIEDSVHEPFLIVDAFFQRYHGLCSADPIYIIDLKNDVLGMIGILGADLTKDIKFSGSDMRHRNVRNLIEPFQNKFSLVGFF